MAVSGSTILIAVNTGTEATPVWTVVPCQQSASYSVSNSPSEYTCKDTDDTQYISGTRTRSLSVEAYPTAYPELNTTPSGVEQIIRSAAETGTEVQGQIQSGGTGVENFEAIIASYEISTPVGEPMSVSMELTISGALTPVP